MAALSVWTAACTNSVSGNGVRAEGGPAQSTTMLDEQDLDDILLDGGELNDVLATTQIEITDQVDEMTDDSADVSAPECTVALYSAEEPVYAGTDYTAVLTRLAGEPGEDYEHWVEETAVAMPSASAAEEFVEDSARQWADCADRTISISDGEDWYDWELGQVTREAGIVIQESTALDPVVWQCEHTVAAASNVILEASVCAERISDEATAIIIEMLVKAAQR